MRATPTLSTAIALCAALPVLTAAHPVLAEDSVDTTTITDSASTNTVLVVTGLLVVVGLAMVALTWWFWRSTQPDPEALGPLVTMSRRGFSRLDPVEQRRRLDLFRPSPDRASAEEPGTPPELLPPIDEERAVDLDDDVDEDDVDDDDVDDDDVDDDDVDDDDVDDDDVDNDVGSLPQISWDDDEWPDLDDWSGAVPRRRLADEIESAAEADPDTDAESLRRGPIDPLLG